MVQIAVNMDEEQLKELLENLIHIQIHLDAADFDEWFGNVGCGYEHLWRKFSIDYRHDLLSFSKYMFMAVTAEDIKLKNLFIKGLLSKL